MNDAAVPPGWPPEVPPPSAGGWEQTAVAWLLDQCPADHRGQPVWRRHPVALAWVATHHVEAQVEAMRTCYRTARVGLADHLEPEAMPEVLAALEAEGLRLRAVSRAVSLVADALRGKTYVPRL
ncbi:hypothetical protein [Mobilicoccus massiliensis]|uniref:hypothetical protein n=1 Tax=Mobilicoccus massiliensis TaxID=1522310 RepID=UPI00058F6B1D|nr:hypothetical protein [Mobilicoccus massiliensis]